MKRILSVLLCILLICGLFTGCSGNDKSIDFIYPFNANVNSYDPQVASTSDEFLIIENTFEGLIRIDDEGNIQKGVADSWSISDDGKIYTFKLKTGIKWNIDTEKRDDGTYKDSRLEFLGYDFNPDITAHDFVFALQRACLPITECPLFTSISSITNASKIHSGKLPASKLGVTAIDDYTLQITLDQRDDSFMTALTTAVAMPCNKDFFVATKGKYGLETKYTLFNGQLYVSQILESSYLLKANDFYKGEFPAPAKELTLKILNEETKGKTLELLEKGYYDAAFISGTDTESIKSAKGITYTPYNDTTWTFLLNTSNEIMQSESMRKAFMLGLTRLNNTGKEYLSNAGYLTPSSCVIGSKVISESFGETAPRQDNDKSVELWKKGLDVIGLNDIELTVITTPSMQESVKRMLQGIQAGIGTVVKDSKGNSINFTIKIETMSENELRIAILKREYAIAFYPFKSQSNSALAFLKEFSSNNPTGFDTEKLDKAIESAEASANPKYIKQAEDAILDSASIIPMLYETSYYASANGVSKIQFHAGTGRVSFVGAIREE